MRNRLLQILMCILFDMPRFHLAFPYLFLATSQKLWVPYCFLMFSNNRRRLYFPDMHRFPLACPYPFLAASQKLCFLPSPLKYYTSAIQSTKVYPNYIHMTPYCQHLPDYYEILPTTTKQYDILQRAHFPRQKKSLQQCTTATGFVLTK